MLGGAGYSIDDAMGAYALWWREAGFHTATSDAAHDWRAVAPASAPVERPAANAREDRAAAMPAPPQADPVAAPDTLAAFVDWLAHETAQPEAPWGGPLFLPASQVEAPLLLILDMPDAEPIDSAMPLNAAQHRFLRAMLSTVGLAPEEIALASLATRRPAGGLLDDAVLGQLGARMRHYLVLARPRAAILIGDRTSRALLGSLASGPMTCLPEVNHVGGTLPALPLPALDLLMNRPAIKARSWQTLRLLNGVLHR